MFDPEQMSAELFHGVLDRGHVIQFVPADPTSVFHGGSPYAYTAGRTMWRRPEFLVTGLPMRVSEALLNELVRHDGSAFADSTVDQLTGTELTLSLGATSFTVKLIRSDASLLRAAWSMFGAHMVVALQVLWADKHGKYPTFEAQAPEQPVHPWGRTPLVREDRYADPEEGR